jgi:hypothetical protein
MASLGRALLDTAVPALRQRAAEVGWTRTVERDLQKALDDATGAGSVAIELTRWPKVGRVDLMLPGRIAVELKWCKGGDTLGNCAWDAAKLAAALAEGQITEGYLVAGAPLVHWATRNDGVELFGKHALFTGDAIVRHYEGWWRFWCKAVVTRPVELPASFALSAVSAVQFDLDPATSWELRLARVELLDATPRPHVCPHRWRGERCRPRRWDADGLGGLPV